LHGLATLAPDGVVIPFADGHTRQLPRLTAGPFRYATRADAYLDRAMPYARIPLKQAVNRGGDRQGNRGLYLLAVGRMGWDPATKAYVARRTASALSLPYPQH